MVLAAANCEKPVQRPCSTQKTLRGRRRCARRENDAVFADDAILLAAADEARRASSNNGRLLRFMRTSWLTEAPLLYGGTGTGRPSRPRYL